MPTPLWQQALSSLWTSQSHHDGLSEGQTSCSKGFPWEGQWGTCRVLSEGLWGKKLVSNPQAPVHSEGCVESLCMPREVRINDSSVSSSLSSPTSLVVNLSSDLLLNVSFSALVDSGSTHCFIESCFVCRHNISTCSVPPISLCLFDGTTNAIITESVELPIWFPHGHTQSVDLFCTLLDSSCSVVLRHNWLTYLLQSVDWLGIGQYYIPNGPTGNSGGKPLSTREHPCGCWNLTKHLFPRPQITSHFPSWYSYLFQGLQTRWLWSVSTWLSSPELCTHWVNLTFVPDLVDL